MNRACKDYHFSANISAMKMRNQSGDLNILLIPLILVIILLVVAAVFAYNTYGKEQKYKNHTDKIVAAAVQDAKKQESAEKDKEFIEKEKQPLVSYTAPSNDGSISVQYPKTWSGYVNDTGDGQGLFDGYFQPHVVPADEGSDDTAPYALRIELVDETYDQVLQNYSDLVSQKTVKVQPYSLPKVKSVVGSKLTGQIQDNKKGQEVILPLRGNTLEVWTESNSYVKDFNNIILPNLTFLP